MKTRIGLIFGSFNPIHNGHIEIAKQAINNNFVDEVVFIPAMQNPFKEKYDISFEERYNMCKLACEELHDNRFGVLKIEEYVNDLYGDTKTYNVLSFLNDCSTFCNIQTEFVIICGDDMYNQIPMWYNGEEIMNDNKFIIVSRNTPVMKLNNNVIAVISENNYDDVSSTLIRDAIKNTNDVSNFMQSILPNTVLAEIISKNFYK